LEEKEVALFLVSEYFPKNEDTQYLQYQRAYQRSGPGNCNHGQDGTIFHYPQLNKILNMLIVHFFHFVLFRNKRKVGADFKFLYKNTFAWDIFLTKYSEITLCALDKLSMDDNIFMNNVTVKRDEES
ncbi:hypothetical protein ACJX0J_040686, partial [Zea mays]